MALKGNLRDFTVTQLLNLINVAQKTGTLVVEGPNEKVFVSFREGKLAYAQIGEDGHSLAYVLHRAKKYLHLSTVQLMNVLETSMIRSLAFSSSMPVMLHNKISFPAYKCILLGWSTVCLPGLKVYSGLKSTFYHPTIK